MKNLFLLALAVSIAICNLLACAPGTTGTIPPVSASTLTPVKKTMKAFGSDQELKQYLRELAEKQRRLRGAAARTVALPASEPAMEMDAQAGKPAESVTNNQHAGVDEGGIVKVHGNHLVVLR